MLTTFCVRTNKVGEVGQYGQGGRVKFCDFAQVSFMNDPLRRKEFLASVYNNCKNEVIRFMHGEMRVDFCGIL